ncbi:translation initiation factor IF-2 subunit gamma [Thermoplasmatales archaeon ex4484_30]|nr:MAG: translation initiation factor IF-2 subunit gamma [Thermoplasmata archaeon]OYT61893.1 MAG: translation initiation factor IF-2 subunit gamma [Thermoplasmatales archaeon ex4484_30]
MSQPEINIGMVGHVDHGKTTLTQALTGKWTDEHSEELKRGISIKLGYADTTFYKCPNCPEPLCYSTKPVCPHCGEETEMLRKVSFVDAPGHETLMAVVISGAALMDGALLLIAANESCPQPQTEEHLMALDIVGAKNIVIVQNKIDLVNKEEAVKNYEEILAFIEGTCAENSPIIPISAHHETNLDYLIMAIEEYIPTPPRDKSKPPLMYTARSFDVNKPGIKPEELKGGVIGGSLKQGVLRVGDNIEIRPGKKIEEHGKVRYEPIYTEIASIITGGEMVEEAGPGGLLGIGTYLDPSLTKADALAGKVIGKEGKLPPVFYELEMDINLLQRIVGEKEKKRMDEIRVNEPLMLTVGTATTVGIVKHIKKDYMEVSLKIPVCAEKGQRVAISRNIMGRWRLVGYGEIK